jgi:hypothetical protein
MHKFRWHSRSYDLRSHTFITTGALIRQPFNTRGAARPWPPRPHAADFILEDATRVKQWFYWRIPTLLLVDEAHLLTDKRQQSRLKTIPSRPDLTLVLITSEPDQIEASQLTQ